MILKLIDSRKTPLAGKCINRHERIRHMEKGLLEKTGKSLEHWVGIVKSSKIEKHGEIVKFLKSEHDFTHGFANFVSLKARAADAGSFNADDLVAAQYSKGKEALKPIFDLMISKIQAFGDNIEIVPKKANVSLKTKKQFALIQPSTKTRLDIGLKLRDKPTGERLQNSGPFGAMCTHRVQVFNEGDVDQELLDWIKEAWEQSS